MSLAPTLLLLALSQLPPLEPDPPAPVAGVVVDPEGNPIEGAEVVLVGDRWKNIGSRALGRGRSDGQGKFEVTVTKDELEHPGPFPSLSGILAYRPGSRMAGATVGVYSLSRPPGEDIRRLVLRPAVPAPFRVLDPDGKPLAGAKLTCRSIWESVNVAFPPGQGVVWLPADWADRFSATTDADGRATLPDFAPEEIRLIGVQSPQFGIQSTLVKRGVGEAVRTITLSPVGSLSGRVVADDPALVRDLALSVAPHSGFNRPWTLGRVVKTDAEGRFEIPALTPGRPSLSLVDGRPDFSHLLRQPENVTIEPGKRSEVECTLVRGVRVRGVVRERETGRPIARASLFINSSQESATTSTDPQGRYEAVLPPGEIMTSLWLSLPFVHPADSALPTATPAPGAVEIEMPPFELVRGREVGGFVLDENNAPVGGATVEAIWPIRTDDTNNALHWTTARTNGLGEFLLKGLPPDVELRISARHEDSRTAADEPLPVGDARPLTLCIGPENTTALTGRVVNSEGRPIAGAEVQVRELLQSSERYANRDVSWEERWAIRTDANGQYQTPRRLGRDRIYAVIVRAEAHQPGSTDWQRMAAADVTPMPDVVLQPAPVERDDGPIGR